MPRSSYPVAVVGPPPVIRIVNPDSESKRDYPQKRPITALDRILMMLTSGYDPLNQEEEETQQQSKFRMRKPQHLAANEPGEVSPTIFHFRVSRR